MVEAKQKESVARDFKDWFLMVIKKAGEVTEDALATREGFKPTTLKRFEEGQVGKITPHIPLERTHVAKKERVDSFDPVARRLLKKDGIVSAEKLAALLEQGKFNYKKDWVEAA